MIRVPAALFLFSLAATGAAQPADNTNDSLQAMAALLEQALVQGNPAGYLALVAPSSDPESARNFAQSTFVPGITRAVLRERDRLPLAGAAEGEAYRVLFEAFLERGRAARIATWQLDVIRNPKASGSPGTSGTPGTTGTPGMSPWLIADGQQLSSVDGLHRLMLDASKQFTAKNLVITALDFSLELPAGNVFVAETPEGETALVLRGNGTMRFEPQAPAERGQVRIFAGSETLVAPFEYAFVRVNPFDFERRVSPVTLSPRAVETSELRRAQAIFAEHITQTFALNLSDLSRETWSLTPPLGDFVAEVRTKRHGTLTYARSTAEAEDITLFDRRRRKNISVYASPEKLALRGPSYDEDTLIDYDIIHYDVEANFWPDRVWVDGRTTVRLKTTARATTTLTLRLAEALTVRSVSSPEMGRLLFLRVVGQNSLIVNLPATVLEGTELTLDVVYAGRLPPQSLEREAIEVEQDRQEQQEMPVIAAEPRFIYSNRSYWYAQSPTNDYATATIRVTVPTDADAVGTGELKTTRIVAIPTPGGSELRKLFVFSAAQPLRYLSCLITRLNQVETANVHVGPAPGRELSASLTETATVEAEIASVALSIKANPRQQSRGRAMLERVSRIVRFYSGLVAGAPYPSFTLALTESDLPGGHSPAYFAILNQPLPMSPVSWRGDPVSFDDFPSFFLAHEVAHQWWGQAVGWKNYHEQWISEGFAQYFAALYAREERGDDVFVNLLRQMRKWSLEHSEQGPVALGYRLGHIRGEGRVFRAIVYNKAAMVLHMLRRLVGDDAFFGGVRRFYREYRFRKAGTDDFRKAMEAEAGVSLTRFFEGWIEGMEIPRLTFRSTVAADGASISLHFEHSGAVMDVPALVTLVYESGATDELVVRVTEKVAEVTVPLTGRLRLVQVNRDSGALADFLR
jgi:Peptidase family M1 domain